MENDKKKKTAVRAAIVTALVLCFAAGLAVPLLFRSASSRRLQKITDVYNLLENQWYFANDVDDLDDLLIEQAIAGMTNLEIDPHTNYFNLEEAQSFSSALKGSNAGIGISYYTNSEGNMVVQTVFINSTADTAGLQEGDVIVQVGELTAAENDADALVREIQNHRDQDLRLVLERDGEQKTVTVKPGTYDSTVSVSQEGDTGIIRLVSFSETTGDAFENAVDRLKKNGAKNLIIDVRDNTGGYLSSVLQIASKLLPADSVVFQEKDKSGRQTEKKVNKDAKPVAFDEIVVLQNGSTASASEVLIGALRDNLKNVRTVGTTSYGKGTEQVSVPFKDGTSIKYTVAEWLTPKGKSINRKGFTPDEEVESEGLGGLRYPQLEAGTQVKADEVSPYAAAIQTFLQELGYPVDRTDSYFSWAGSEALSQFQSDHGLEATGVADVQTFNALEKAAIAHYMEGAKEADAQLNKALALLGEKQEDVHEDVDEEEDVYYEESDTVYDYAAPLQ